ncbi:MAG: pstS [Candidatus Brocadiaceae bacterium]|nr:pstS [Candidatus Brocadiaceae bacterium]
MVKKTWLLVAFLNFSLAGIAFAGEEIKVDANIQPYTKTGGVSGNLSSIGSDTMNNLMT